MLSLALAGLPAVQPWSPTRVRAATVSAFPSPPESLGPANAPAGWELEGTLCEAQNTETGVVWECPLLVPLDPIPRHLRAPSKQVGLRSSVLGLVGCARQP